MGHQGKGGWKNIEKGNGRNERTVERGWWKGRIDKRQQQRYNQWWDDDYTQWDQWWWWQWGRDDEDNEGETMRTTRERQWWRRLRNGEHRWVLYTPLALGMGNLPMYLAPITSVTHDCRELWAVRVNMHSHSSLTWALPWLVGWACSCLGLHQLLII